MKITFITGSHPRHAFIARKLAETGFLDCLIIEKRESFIPSPPEGIPKNLRKLFIHHFKERERIENEVFGVETWPNCDVKVISHQELNSAETQSFLRNKKSDLLLSYGCHQLSTSTLECFSGEKWNFHGGLSPWYKGAVTHFWPSYMLEPQMTGMTVHHLTQDLDAGDIIHQCVAELVPGDTLHKLAARAVIKLGDHIPRLLKKLSDEGSLTSKKNTTTGMLWRGEHWRPEHLKLIYEQYNDQIVDEYLNGKIEKNPPKIYQQF
jgi:folate-dependent phosphoribosylglycinamide formyltransferase PurN